MSDRGKRTPELMAPAGDWEAMRAAVANGADAVYFGLSNFNARHRAANFTIEELPRIMEYLHGHNVRGFLTFNTLMFSDELPQAVEMIAAMARARVDAVIVHDLGLTRLIRAVAPGLEIHGSTQMTLTDPRGIEYVRGLGIGRVVLARELSMADITKIRAGTPMPLEVFVHGALCVSYSGQCLTSESLGGRSANRGQCAQACRLPYDLVVDGELRDLGDRAYLLSPQDLAAHELVGKLVDLGVSCFKIEGRLKSAHYVAATTQTYRAAVDAAVAGRPFSLSPQERADLEQTFSRGFTHGFLDGVNHQTLVPALFPKNRGVKVGEVVRKTPRGVVIKLPTADRPLPTVPLRAGDGVVLDEGHPEQDEQGGRVFAVRPGERGTIEIELGRGDVNLSAIAVGAIVWKTDDPALRRRLEHSFSRDQVARREGLWARVEARVGEALRVELRDAAGRIGRGEWAGPLQKAQKHPITVELLREQLGRLGDTPFELREVELLGEGAMVPKSVLNEVRRAAVEELVRARTSGEPILQLGALDLLRRHVQSKQWTVDTGGAPVPQLSVLVRTLEQLSAVIGHARRERLGWVYCDLEDVRKYKEAVAKAREAGMRIALATTRIVKPGEDGLLRQVAECAPDAILVRNLSGLALYRLEYPAMTLLGDYSLNVANELTAGLLLEAGLSRLVPGYDLNFRQLAAMVSCIDPGVFEVVLHQHMPMFYMEHCVFAATLSNGKDFRDCGRPCDRHRVDLRDRVGAAHPLIADVGCRNTVYNGAAQSAGEYLPKMKELGLRHFRIEMLRENAPAAAGLIDHYLDLLDGDARGAKARTRLRVFTQLGVTRGTLDFE